MKVDISSGDRQQHKNPVDPVVTLFEQVSAFLRVAVGFHRAALGLGFTEQDRPDVEFVEHSEKVAPTFTIRPS